MIFAVNIISAQEIKNGLEKIYVQTDRPMYFPGETIWFKAYVVDNDNTVTSKSEVMYLQLIAPDGSYAKTLKLQVKQGYA